MGWVCPVCSTNNGDDAEFCMVCDAVRSEMTSIPDEATDNPTAVDEAPKKSLFDEARLSSARARLSSILGSSKVAYDSESEYSDALKLLSSSPYEGFEKMLECAKRGYAEAQLRIGECYRDGIGVVAEPSKAMTWFEKAARQGNAEAQYALALCYCNGNGTYKNYYSAVIWYKKAAEQGYAQAQCALGDCYCFGTGVDKSYETAFSWYEKAAKSGYAEAELALGECYYNGYGVEISKEEAFEHFEHAAKSGSPRAQYRLGEYYEKDGIRFLKILKAIEWYKRAAAQDYEPAREALIRLKII